MKEVIIEKGNVKAVKDYTQNLLTAIESRKDDFSIDDVLAFLKVQIEGLEMVENAVVE